MLCLLGRVIKSKLSSFFEGARSYILPHYSLPCPHPAQDVLPCFLFKKKLNNWNTFQVRKWPSKCILYLNNSKATYKRLKEVIFLSSYPTLIICQTVAIWYPLFLLLFLDSLQSFLILFGVNQACVQNFPHIHLPIHSLLISSFIVLYSESAVFSNSTLWI